MKTDRQLAQLFKRAGLDERDKQIENMPDEFKNGFYKGFVEGREAQRISDIQVAKSKLL